MKIQLNEKQRELFNQAADSYNNLVQKIESIYDLGLTDRLPENFSVTDLICSLDQFLQGCLLKIAASDGYIAPIERFFIENIAEEFEEVCLRNRGYKHFIEEGEAEKISRDFSLFFDFKVCPPFLSALRSAFGNPQKEVIRSFETIFKAFIEIDDQVWEKELSASESLIDMISCFMKDGNQQRKQAGIEQRAKTSSAGQSLKIPFEKVYENIEDQELKNDLLDLNNLIGLEKVKEEVLKNINLIRVNIERRKKGLVELQVSNHLVFTGNPGTGKTTVARILANIYKRLGVVSKGQFIETDRSGLVGGYVGQTALKTAAVVKKAVGGILFIDEAYSLAGGYENDYGKEAVDTLVKLMEDNRDDLVVIVAGYINEMHKFINMNTGLSSRFNKYIDFEDYSPEELLEIFLKICKENDFLVTQEAQQKALKFFRRSSGSVSFGNGRGVRNYFENVVTNQAARVLNLKNPSDTEFKMIISEDLEFS